MHATNTTVFTPQLLDLYARYYAKPGAFDAVFAYYRALNETARRNKPLATIKLAMPILAIGGGGHGGFGAAQAEQVRRYASDVSLPGCGHWLPEECAHELNPLVVDFLAQRWNGHWRYSKLVGTQTRSPIYHSRYSSDLFRGADDAG